MANGLMSKRKQTAAKAAATVPRISARTRAAIPVSELRQGPPLKFLSRDEVLKLVGVSYGTLWGWIREGNFPPARELSGNKRASRIYWLEHEVLEWMANRPPRLPKGTRAVYGS
jgi:predicted DNA-binding transcriptional regulator AlpA